MLYLTITSVSACSFCQNSPTYLAEVYLGHAGTIPAVTRISVGRKAGRRQKCRHTWWVVGATTPIGWEWNAKRPLIEWQQLVGSMCVQGPTVWAELTNSLSKHNGWKIGEITKAPLFDVLLVPIRSKFDFAERPVLPRGTQPQKTSQSDMNTWFCDTLSNSKIGNMAAGRVVTTDSHLPFCTTLAVIPVTCNLIGWHIDSRFTTLSINGQPRIHRPATLLSLSCSLPSSLIADQNCTCVMLTLKA